MHLLCTTLGYKSYRRQAFHIHTIEPSRFRYVRKLLLGCVLSQWRRVRIWEARDRVWARLPLWLSLNKPCTSCVIQQPGRLSVMHDVICTCGLYESLQTRARIRTVLARRNRRMGPPSYQPAKYISRGFICIKTFDLREFTLLIYRPCYINIFDFCMGDRITLHPTRKVNLGPDLQPGCSWPGDKTCRQ